jgi:ubiquinone/menaquinone biosynthesis C-methylase UbiE
MIDTIFDQYAADYDTAVEETISASGESVQFFAELKVDLTQRILGCEKPATVLDFGCGIGNATRALSTAFPAATVTGFDISRESLAEAQRLSNHVDTRVRFITNDLPELPFSDSAFELAFTSCVFHHIDEPSHTLWAQELRRVLKPGAPLFLFEHNPYNPLTVHAVRACPFDRGVKLLPPSYATRLLGKVGFLVERPCYYFFFPRALRFFRLLEIYLRWLPVGAQYFVVARRPM